MKHDHHADDHAAETTTPVASTLAGRAHALLAGGDRSDPRLPEDEAELRQIRAALREARLTEAQLAARLGWGQITAGSSLTGQRPTSRAERFQMAVAVVEMLADREAAQASRAREDR